jgi:import receptor subunit TOM70
MLPENPSTGDETLTLGLQALDAADYIHAVTLINEAIEQGVSWDAGRAEALNLRGTFKCVSFFSLIQYPYSLSHSLGS